MSVSQFQAERDSILNVNKQQQAELESLNAIMSTVSLRLDSIAQQEQWLYMPKEGRAYSKKRVLENLKEFEKLLNRQRAEIIRLKDSLKTETSPNLAKLNIIITHLNNQLAEKDRTIQKLKKEIARNKNSITQLTAHIDTLKENVSTLKKDKAMQEEALHAQDQIINEGYVKMGTKKELKKQGILTGSVFTKKKVDYAAINKDQFARVDIRDFTEVIIESSKAKILTNMPESSYRIVSTSKGSTLYILNPSDFWSLSTILIIQTD